MNNHPIYSDGLVDVYDTEIRLKKYYYPSAKPKIIKLQDIREMKKKQPTFKNGKWRLWGTGNFITWFPLDRDRPRRDCIFFIRLATQKIRIGFTVENTNAFLEAVGSGGLEIKDT